MTRLILTPAHRIHRDTLVLARREALSAERADCLRRADMQGVHRCEAEARELVHQVLARGVRDARVS